MRRGILNIYFGNEQNRLSKGQNSVNLASNMHKYVSIIR